MKAGMLKIVNQINRRVMNLSSLKYAVIPTPMYSMSLLRQDRHAQCQPKFVFPYLCGSDLPFTRCLGWRGPTTLIILVYDRPFSASAGSPCDMRMLSLCLFLGDASTSSNFKSSSLFSFRIPLSLFPISSKMSC